MNEKEITRTLPGCGSCAPLHIGRKQPQPVVHTAQNDLCRCRDPHLNLMWSWNPASSSEGGMGTKPEERSPLRAYVRWHPIIPMTALLICVPARPRILLFLGLDQAIRRKVPQVKKYATVTKQPFREDAGNQNFVAKSEKPNSAKREVAKVTP